MTRLRLALRTPSAADLELAAQLHEVTGLPVVVRPREERREPITLPAPPGTPCCYVGCFNPETHSPFLAVHGSTRCERHQRKETTR